FHGVGDLRLGEAAHTGDLSGKLGEFVSIRLDGVLVHDHGPMRSGQRPACGATGSSNEARTSSSARRPLTTRLRAAPSEAQRSPPVRGDDWPPDYDVSMTVLLRSPASCKDGASAVAGTPDCGSDSATGWKRTRPRPPARRSTASLGKYT